MCSSHPGHYIYIYIERERGREIHIAIVTHMYMYIYIYIHTYIHTYVHTYIHTYIHTYMCKDIHDATLFYEMLLAAVVDIPQRGVYGRFTCFKIVTAHLFQLQVSFSSHMSENIHFVCGDYGRFPKFHRVFLGRDPGTLKSDIVSKKHPQLICSDLRLSN